MANEDERELLAGLQRRSKAAASEAVSRHWSSVLKFFLNKVDAHADDLRQETFERFLRNAHTFEGRSSLRVYILGIARNVLLEYIRKKRKHQHEDLDQLSIADCGIGIASLLGHRADLHRVLHALRRTPINAQIVLELHYCERLTAREMGILLEISPNTVRSRISRARDRLQEEIARADQPRISTASASSIVLTETPVDLRAWEDRIRREVFGAGPAPLAADDAGQLETPAVQD